MSLISIAEFPGSFVVAGLISADFFRAYRRISQRKRDEAVLLNQLKFVNPKVDFIKVDRSKGKLAIVYRRADYNVRKAEVSKAPPRSARAAVRLLGSYKDHEAIIGDLDELYGKIQAENGTFFAKVWYWKQATTTVISLWRARVLKWGILITLGEKVRHFIR